MNLKNCPFQPNNCSKIGKNQPKLAAQTSLWPKNDSPNPTRAKKCQPEPDPSQKTRGPTQPYWLCRGLSGLKFRIYQFIPTLMQLLLFRLSIFISVLNTKVWVIEYFILVLEWAEKKACGSSWAMPHHSKSGKGICGQCPFFKHRARALAGGHRAFMGNLL